MSALFGDFPSARQCIECEITMVQRSCGWSVPFMEFKGPRPNIEAWAKVRSKDAIRKYWNENNRSSIDGLPTNILKSK